MSTEERLNKLENIIRIGIVTNQYPAICKVRVKLPDADEMISAKLPVLVRASKNAKDYFMPEVGSSVICFFLPFGAEQGFIFGSFYSEKDETPVKDAKKNHYKFSDKSFIEYDAASHTFSIKTTESVTINAKTIILNGNVETTGNIKILGDTDQEGNIFASGSIKDDGGNTNHHSH